MESVRQYGFINAKVRGMRSGLLPEAAYRSMLAVKEPRDIFSFLSQTRYRSVVDGIEIKTPDAMEKALFLEEIREMRAIQKYGKGGTKDIISVLLERDDCERLKTILRAWHSGAEDSGSAVPAGSRAPLEPSAFGETIVYPYPVQALLSSKSLEEFADLLEGTPFREILKSRAALYEEKKTLFPIEVALDQCVYGRLWKASGPLSRTDRNIFRRLVGIEIDLKNLDWILRFRNYYNLSMVEIGDLLLPNGWRLGTEGIKKLLAGGKISEAILDIGRVSPVPFTWSEEEALSLNTLERFLYQVLFIEARRAFMAFPLSLGAILGYATLLRIESRNIRTLVHAKSYGMTAQQIEPFLVM
jgi:vacuolar-type H+-ATPase subunit C/Vma6